MRNKKHKHQCNYGAFFAIGSGSKDEMATGAHFLIE